MECIHYSFTSRTTKGNAGAKAMAYHQSPRVCMRVILVHISTVCCLLICQERISLGRCIWHSCIWHLMVLFLFVLPRNVKAYLPRPWRNYLEIYVTFEKELWLCIAMRHFKLMDLKGMVYWQYNGFWTYIGIHSQDIVGAKKPLVCWKNCRACWRCTKYTYFLSSLLLFGGVPFILLQIIALYVH